MNNAHLALALLLCSCAGAPTAPERVDWQGTLDRVSQAVVSIRIDAPRAFDTEGNRSSQATGFVVDAERGIILTNRHVVQPGPVKAEAIFLNHEEVKLEAIYRDPVHDFGFFRFDPAKLHFMKPAALELAPERAQVGIEIRVVGNDAGDKLSILGGTIARLDRAAPYYGRNKYNDFNTFYIQSASGTSGGSSGSPVVDAAGKVVALNAGSKTRAATSYFLPLDRVARALELVQKGQPVPRGTLMATLEHTSFDELRRLGLQRETEARVREAFPGGTGLLVIERLVEAGPAFSQLDPGDILVSLDGEPIDHFLPLETRLDARVGQRVKLGVERGGKAFEVVVEVADLHAVSPSAYLEVGGAVLNELSYQQARNHGVQVKGIYVASQGYMLDRARVPDSAVISEINGTKVATLAEAAKALEAVADGTPLTLRYFKLSSAQRSHLAVAIMDRKWFPMRTCIRKGGAWPCVDAAPPPATKAKVHAGTTGRPSRHARTKRLANALVTVDFFVPFKAEGVHGPRFRGTGLVVDAEAGLVVVDRDTVPIAPGDVRIIFHGSLAVPGEVRFLHPEHNLAVIAYDPKALGTTPVEAAELAPRKLNSGDKVWQIGLRSDHGMIAQSAEVAYVQPAGLPVPDPPRFRESNLDVITLVTHAPSIGSVLADDRGRVHALWSSFSYDARSKKDARFYGMPAELVQEAVEAAKGSRVLRSLDVELAYLPLQKARQQGLPDDWAVKLEGLAPERRRALTVKTITVGAPAEAKLRPGDLLLAIDAAPIVSFRDVERAVRKKAEVKLTLFRDGKTLEVQTKTVELDGKGIDRMLIWAGALLHAPHRAVPAQRAIPAEGIYVALYWYGSPANRHKLYAATRVIAVDEQPVNTLDEFLAAVKDRPDGSALRLGVQSLNGKHKVLTIELDLEFFPTAELRRGPTGWVRTRL